MPSFATDLDGIATVGSSAERDARFPVPETGRRVLRTDTGTLERYSGTAWIDAFAAALPGDGRTTTSLAALLANNIPINVKDYGAIADGVRYEGAGAITTGTNVLTVAGAAFTSAVLGQKVRVNGAGASDGSMALAATVTGLVSPTQLQLSINASRTVTARDVDLFSFDNWAIIQGLIDRVAAFGGGTIVVPAGRSGKFYAMTGGIYGRSNVILTGEGRLSHLRNLYPGPYGGANLVIGSTGGFLRLGGVEGASPYWVQDETFYACGDEFKGQRSISLTTPADAAHFVAGGIVFIRTTAKDPNFAQKDIPLATELNEIDRVDTVAGVVYFKRALRNEYRACQMALSGTRADPRNPTYKIEVIRRFQMHQLQISSLVEAGISGACLGFGGGYECTFADLTIDSAQVMQLNAMAHCRFERITARCPVAWGEVAYYSHDNIFDIDFTHYVHVDNGVNPNMTPLNGFNLTEGASHNVVKEGTRIDYNGPGIALLLGSGEDNKVLGARVVASASSALGAIVMMSYGTTYKPRGCLVEDCTVEVGNNNGLVPRFAVAIDSGGTYGGDNLVRNLTIIGTPAVASVGLTRRDIANAQTSAVGCKGNSVDGVVHRLSDSAGGLVLPNVAQVVDVNNTSPVAGNETVIDPTWKYGDNPVRNVAMKTSQRTDKASEVGQFSTANVPATVAAYTIGRWTAGSHSQFDVTGKGRVSGTANSKSIAVVADGTTLFTIAFAAADVGSWDFEVQLAGITPVSGSYPSSNLFPSRQFLRWRAYKNAVLYTEGTLAKAHDFTASDFVLSCIVNTVGADTVFVDRWQVVPSRDEVGLVDWAKLFALTGSYPVIG